MFNVSIDTRGTINELSNFFQYLPRNARGAAAEAMSDDLIGTPHRGLRHYPAYRYVNRSSVYRPKFKSDRQRRFVMAGIRSGKITPGTSRRTKTFQNSWQRAGSGINSRIVGQLPHEGWPNALASRVGWRDTDTIIESNLTHAQNAAERAVQGLINQRGYG